MKRIGLVIIVVLNTIIGVSQNVLTEKLNIYQFKSHYTFVAAHHEFMTYYQNSHFSSFELNAGGYCLGNKPWHQRYNYPHNGIGVFYTDTRNEYLGKIFSVFYYIDFPLIIKKNWSFNFNFSSGLAWHNKIFDIENNYNNIIIATRLNGIFNAEFSINYHLTKQLNAIAGLDFAHTSNGLVKTPNIGINMPALHAGISYNLTEEKPNYLYSEKEEFQKNNDLLISVSAGYKEFLLDGKFMVSTMSIDYGRHINYKIRPGIGMDIYYDGSVFIKIKDDSTLTNKFLNKMRYGVFVSNYFKFGRISIITQPGYIFYSSAKMSDRFFQNIGFIYCITPRVYGRILLRSHVFTADFIEWGIAFKIGKIVKGFNFND